MMKTRIFPILTIAISLLLLITSCDHHARKSHKPDIVSDINHYHSLVIEDSSNHLVDIADHIPDIVLDIRYATQNNFTGEQIYTLPKAFIRRPVVVALAAIQQELRAMGLGLKIFDAYRPYAATVKFYEVYPDTNFVAAPWKGSVHNRGCAVDVGLVKLETGQPLEMPTPFDDFSEKASHQYLDLPEHILRNRQILRKVMEKHGFSAYDAEWWHYDFQGWEDYELMDIPFEELDGN